MTEPAVNPGSAAAKEPAVKSRIFIVDDHAMFREGLRQLIERESDLAVCGDAASADEALPAIARLKPGLVIVDLSLSGTSGIDLIKAIREQHEDIPVLVVSMHEETLYAERALRAGAMGYVMKAEPGKTVKSAIRKVIAGNMHLSEAMATTVFAKYVRGAQAAPPPSPIESLSDRELEVFRLLGEGKGIRQIAEEFQLSVPTINTFRNRIKEKLRLKSSTEVMLHAMQWVQHSAH
jgi:DNA-binding NarL/FixJ family response regulator